MNQMKIESEERYMKMFNSRLVSAVAAGALSVFAVIPCNAGAQETLPPDKVWTLEDCVNYALEENISLKKSRLEVESSELDLKQSKAAMYPSVAFSTSQSLSNKPYQETSSTITGSEILQTNDNTSYMGSYGLNAQWSIFDGLRLRNTVRQNELNGRLAELNVNISQNSILESIAQVYVQILYASEAVDVARLTLETSVAECERGKELMEAGSISKADYAQLLAQQSSDRYQLVSSEATLADYKLQLKQLLEIQGDYEMNIYLPEISDESVLVPLPDKSYLYEAALGTRPEIESGNLNIEASEIGEKISRAGYYPSLSLSAGIGTNHTSGSDMSFVEQVKRGWYNSVGLTLSIPIFSNLQNKTAVRKAEIQTMTAQLELIESRKDLYKTIEGFWLDANSAQKQYIAAKEQLNSASVSYELVSEQFDLGMKNTVELLTEKNNYLMANMQMLQAKYMAVMNIQMLNFYSGKEITIL